MGRRSGAQRAKSQYYTSDLSLHARTIAPSASATCLWCGRTLLVLLAILSAVLRPVFAAFQNPPHPHHGRKRAVFVFAGFLLLTGGTARAQGPVAADRAALVTLYNATAGANWTNNTNWLSNEALSEWHGVTTDGNGRVTELDLYNNRLSGAIPAALGNLANLQTLILEINQLSGGIPAALGNLANLQYLDLCGNQLGGAIPAALGDMASLRYLHLYDNQLSGTIPAALGNLANLAILHLWNNQLSGGIPAALGDMDNLQLLSLYDNQLSGAVPAALGDMASLRYLHLYDNPQLTGTIPPALENLAQLEEFDIRNTGLCVTAGSRLTTIEFRGAVCAATPPPPPDPPPPDPPPSPPPSPPGGGGGGGGGDGGVRQTVPDAPSNLLVDGTDAAVTLTWDAPGNDGGSAITDYEYRIDRRNPWISIGSIQTTHTITGLVNGTEYVFEVRAVNRIGKSFSSTRAEATPEAPEVEVFTLDFAHFANGTGITSEMVLVNVAPHPIRPAIYFYDRGGHLIDPESVVDVTGDLEVTEDGSLSVLTEMEPLGVLTISTHGQGELVSGSVKVLSDGPIGGLVRYSVPAIGEAVVGASPPVGDALFPVRRQEGGINTGVAIHNLGEEAMEARCELMREGVLRDFVSISLEANGQTSWMIDQAFPTADTSDFTGSVRCAAPGRGRFTAIAVEMDAARRIFISVVPVDRTVGRGGETVLDFAHFVNGTWITDLVFVNLETQPSGPAPTPFHTAIPPSRPAIYFYDTEGALVAPESLVDVTGDLEITEDGALTVQTEMEPLGVLTISTHGRGALVSGSVRVVSDGPIGGMLRFEHPALGVAGVGASPPVSDALFPVRRQEGGITTGVALHNLESSPGLLRCDLMREGVLLDAASIPLEANGQTAWLIDQAFPAADTSDFVGSVRCDAVGEGLFSAVALEMDPGNRIFTTLPVVPVPEMSSQE